MSPIIFDMTEKIRDLPSPEAKWDRRFERDDHWLRKGPARFLVENISLFPRGRALDVASGPGKNAVFLAERGFIVDAVDISKVGLSMASTFKRDAGTEVDKRVNLILADLKDYVIRPDMYELIINFYYLDRRLIGDMIGGLKRGGYMVFETFTKAHPGYRDSVEFRGGGSNPENYLDPNELLGLVSPLHIVIYQETTLLEDDMHKRVARLIARKP